MIGHRHPDCELVLLTVLILARIEMIRLEEGGGEHNALMKFIPPTNMPSFHICTLRMHKIAMRKVLRIMVTLAL